MASPDTAHLCVGLRFAGHDYFLLRNLAHDEARREHNAISGLLDQAADATAKGEPLLLFCKSIAEARWYVAELIRRGVSEPAIEEVRG